MNSVERISKGIDWWLRQEAVDSRDGHNAVLDDFESFRAGFLPDRERSRTPDFRKISGHRDRFKILAHMFDMPNLANDRFTGKIIHHSLMFASGGFRLQCFLQAHDQKGYENLRFGNLDTANGAAGVPMDLSVIDGVSRAAVMAKDGEINFGHLQEASLASVDNIFNEHVRVYDWFRDNPDRIVDKIESGEEPVLAMMRSQHVGIELATVHIAVAARLRGDDLAAVPFMEPKSASDYAPDPIYPLAAA